ncbi:MAG: dihydrolipoamide acetyltransferase family protein, partial [Rhodospirillaceae bacterium]|nr:dihydrolipoamide acetyltransferase family protein [Rhodospirillaceae bacterium]
TMEEGTLARWHVRPGDSVEPGQVIAEIETDKSVLELEALEGGEIGELMVEEGAEGVSVDCVIATLLEPGGRRVRVPASPAARRLAREHGIDVSALNGTGPHGRIVAADIEAALAVRSSAEGATGIPATGTAPTTGTMPAAGMDIPFEERPLSTLGKTMARRMAESKATIPHFHCSIDVNVDATLRLRTELNEAEDAPGLSLNDFVVHAVARALRDTPRMNVQYRDDRLIRFRRVDIAVAVAVDEGLVTPVVRGAEALSLPNLASALRDLTERARARKLSVEDCQGGTFTVSNVGMFGIRQSWPIINPPQAGILGVGAAAPRPVAVGDDGGVRVEVATLMSLTLAADHRAVDGVVAGDFLRRVRQALEHPEALTD